MSYPRTKLHAEDSARHLSILKKLNTALIKIAEENQLTKAETIHVLAFSATMEEREERCRETATVEAKSP